MSATDFLGVGETARLCGVRPRVISDLIYERHVDLDDLPMIGGRYAIPRGRLGEIKQVLRSLGKLPGQREA